MHSVTVELPKLEPYCWRVVAEKWQFHFVTSFSKKCIRLHRGNVPFETFLKMSWTATWLPLCNCRGEVVHLSIRNCLYVASTVYSPGTKTKHQVLVFRYLVAVWDFYNSHSQQCPCFNVLLCHFAYLYSGSSPPSALETLMILTM